MSKIFKRHEPKPVSPLGGTAKAVRGKAVPREKPDPAAAETARNASGAKAPCGAGKVEEIGGPEGPEPTRYGDWEIKGRCIDF